MKTSECDIVIVGVGGQGVILISDVIGRAAVKAGKPVRGAETHGMAQRGGSVINHTRIGCRYSPMVASGGADVLLALEPAEALRFGHFLSREGTALINTVPVLPVTVTTGTASYPSLQEIMDLLREECGDVRAIEATALARQAGTAQAMNVVMLGALSRFIPLPEELLLEALSEVVPPKYLEANRRAFMLGKAEVE
ncbi:MAG: indolepyruvate oxidoreductase subunit beta [Methanotrichaceae archaeon]|nr:indolepyruvate oxidoreductase subunit beta [Methanotrichaceae archaeon]